MNGKTFIRLTELSLTSYFKKLPVFFICCIIYSSATAQVRLPRLISDSMVLQRDTKLKIWGWASAGENVAVHFNGNTYKSVTGKDGKWFIMLSPQKAGGPFDMQIDAGNHIIIKNILIGDVWLCSGQSNMEL